MDGVYYNNNDKMEWDFLIFIFCGQQSLTFNQLGLKSKISALMSLVVCLPLVWERSEVHQSAANLPLHH